ncbi:MAG: hypothetical protein L0922_07760 [Candidatus Mariimomonas ferrooxydans]
MAANVYLADVRNQKINTPDLISRLFTESGLEECISEGVDKLGQLWKRSEMTRGKIKKHDYWKTSLQACAKHRIGTQKYKLKQIGLS